MSENLSNIIRIIVFTTFLLIGLYIGIAGWMGSRVFEESEVKVSDAANSQSYEYDGIRFQREQDLKVFLLNESAIKWFPWIFEIPVPPLLIAAMGFGILGGIGGTLKKVVIDKRKFLSLYLIVEPLFACVIACVFFFLSFILPAVLTTGNYTARPEALIGFALLGGIFSRQVYIWLETNVITKIFPKNNQEI